MHEPAWERPSASFKAIQQRLKDRRHTIFAGHLHYYDYDMIDGYEHITMGPTGASFHHEGPGNVDHTMWVTMTENGPKMANIALKGLFDRKGLDPEMFGAYDPQGGGGLTQCGVSSTAERRRGGVPAPWALWRTSPRTTDLNINDQTAARAFVAKVDVFSRTQEIVAGEPPKIDFPEHHGPEIAGIALKGVFDPKGPDPEMFGAYDRAPGAEGAHKADGDEKEKK